MDYSNWKDNTPESNLSTLRPTLPLRQECLHYVFLLLKPDYVQVNKGVTVVDLLSFARELEAQTDLMVRATWCHTGWHTNTLSMQLHSVSLDS